MRWPKAAWSAAVLLALGTLVLLAVAFRAASTDPRNHTVERIIRALDQAGVRCAGLSIDQSPADEPIAVNAEGRCTIGDRQLRVVIIAAGDRPTRDRYLRWLSQQGGGGYFALDDTWGVGSDVAWVARKAHDTIGGTVCLLDNGVCAPLDRSPHRAVTGRVWPSPEGRQLHARMVAATPSGGSG